MENLHLEIAKLIGEPINYQLPVPVELAAIANLDTAEAGEKVYRFSDVETSLDTIIAINSSTGAIALVKRTALSDTEVSFSGLHSQLEYVLVDDVIGKADTNILARRKEAISRGMDKRELKLLIDGIIAGTNVPSSVSIPVETATSGQDLYDVLLAAKHQLEDYGDNFILLAGTTLKEKVDTYDKDNVTSFNYNINIAQRLKDISVNVMKVFGKVESTVSGGEQVLLDTKKAILVAQNSRVTAGKPIWFVRRKINPEIAKLMGADVDKAQRAIITQGTPVQVDGTNTLGYGVYGAEWVVFAITNPKAICVIDASAIL